MKQVYIKYIYIIALLGFVIISCNDLDQYPKDAISKETYFNTANDLKIYTNSFYTALPSASDVYNESADNIIKTTLPDAIQGTRTVPTSGGGWGWSELRNINFYLENSSKCNDEKARERYDGVAKFFRAYFYTKMVKRFGDVPWYEHVISETDKEALLRPRDSRQFIVEKIIVDLDYAIEHLPDDKKANEVTRSTALALKSSFCLYEGTFRKYHPEFNLQNADKILDECIDASEKLMASKKYSLHNTQNPNSDYLNLFASIDPITTEIILARSFTNALQVYHNLNFYTLSSTYGKPGLEKKFVNSYLMSDGSRFTDIPQYDKMFFTEEVNNRDPRLSQTIRTPGYTRIGDTQKLVPEMGYTVTGYHLIKFVTSKSDDVVDKSYNSMPIFRYAEVLLNFAEAKAERGTLAQGDIDKSIKLVRDRAGMPNLNMAAANGNPDPYLASQYPAVTGTNKGVILEIRRERGIELVMENFRWDDVMRWKAASVFKEQFKGMYFPSIGAFDLDGDGVDDVCIYKDTKPNLGKIQYLKLKSDIVLENGESGNIVVNPQIKKIWDEDKDYLYPVPIQERLLNPNLTQNPKWNDGL